MQQSGSADLNELRAFVAVADTGSFQDAARLIGRDGTIVTRRLQSLEARLGVRLVERSTRKVALTDAGLAYLARIRPVLSALQDIDNDIAALGSGEPRGHLRVSLPGSFGQFWLRSLVVEFLETHPGVTVECESSNRFVDLIGERFDVAIRLGILADSRLVARKIANRRRLLCASPEFLARVAPITHPRDLATLPCLCAISHTAPYRWTLARSDSEEACTVSVNGPLATDDAGLMLEAALAGLGVAHMSEWYAAREIRQGRLQPVLPEWEIAGGGGIYLVTPQSKGMSSAARAFAGWMTARLARSPWAALDDGSSDRG